MLNKVFIGYDSREDDAYNVCKWSLKKHLGRFPLDIIALRQDVLRDLGMFTREQIKDTAGRIVDVQDGKHCSTEFSFTRFLVPFLSKRGWSLFVDCDFLFRVNILDIIPILDPKYAVMVVKHDYRPVETIKMDNQIQEVYSRKNWSSFMVFNHEHPSNKNLSISDVNKRSGRWLHNFSWLQDDEIGELDSSWNVLEGWNSKEIDPKAYHMTRGVPSMPGYENIDHADEWREMLIDYSKHKERMG